MFVADSSKPPTAAQLQIAKAAGIKAWLGYVGQAGDDLEAPWAEADFELVRSAGLLTGAFCSQIDDALWVGSVLAAWKLTGFLDDEPGVEGDNSETDAWLAASGTGLYGGKAVMETHCTHGHPAYIASEYPGGAQTASWPPGFPALSPMRPKGWQYLGTQVTSYGTVDLSVYEEAVLAPQEEEDMPLYVVTYADPDAYGGAAAEWLVRGDYSARVHLATNADVSVALANGAVAETLSAAQMASIPNLTAGASPAPAASGTLSIALTGTATPEAS